MSAVVMQSHFMASQRSSNTVPGDDVLEQSIHLSLQDPVFKDALLAVSKKYPFTKPIACAVLDSAFRQAKSSELALKPRHDVDHTQKWVQSILALVARAKQIRHTSKSGTSDSSAIVRCIAKMCSEPLHVSAMLVICEKHGVTCRMLVSSVLKAYIRGSKCEALNGFHE